MITQQQLDGYVGKSIADLCLNGYTSAGENHCAHFVSHVLGYKFGTTCHVMGNGKAPGANLRVQEVFPKCPSVGAWSSRPASLQTCLVFITHASNVNLASKVMKNVPRKHVGIFLNGSIWHYSNSRKQVVKQTPEEFEQHYPSPDNAMYFGSLP
jgi:hypothetical protein